MSLDFENKFYTSETGLNEVKVLLSRLGYETAVPLPDEDDDLWYSRHPELGKCFPIYRAQVKTSTADSSDRHTFNFNQEPFKRSEYYLNASIFVVCLFTTESLRGRYQSDFGIGCFKPSWFRSQTWFATTPGEKMKDESRLKYNFRVRATGGGDFFVGENTKIHDWTDATDYFATNLEDFQKTLSREFPDCLQPTAEPICAMEPQNECNQNSQLTFDF